MQPKFIASYQGESEYEIGGVRYAARQILYHDNTYVPDYAESTLRYLVGCVYGTSSGNRTTFPPAAVCGHFPGYVPARLNPDTYAVEYQHARPQTVQRASGLVALVSARACHTEHEEDPT